MMQPLYPLNTNNTNRTIDVNNKNACYNYNMWNGQNITGEVSNNNSSNDNNSNKDSKTFVRRYDMFIKNTASNDCYSTPASLAEHNVVNINNSNSMYNETPRVNGLGHEHAHQVSKSARNRVSYCDQSPHETYSQMHDAPRMIYGNSRVMNNTHNQVDAMSQTLPLHINNNNNNTNNNISSGVNYVYPFTPKLFEVIPPSPSLVPVALPIANNATESVYNRSSSNDATNILNATVNGTNAYCNSRNNNNNNFTIDNKSMLLAVPATWATSQGPVTSPIPLPTSSLKNAQANNYENNQFNNNEDSGNVTLQPPIYYVPIIPPTQKLQQQEPLNALLLSSHVTPVLTAPQNASNTINVQQKADVTSHSQWPSANYPCSPSTSPSNSTTLPVESLTNVNWTSFTPASSIITVLPSQSVCSVENNTHQTRVNVNLQPERITRAEYVGEEDSNVNSYGIRVTATPAHSSVIYHHAQQQQDQQQLQKEHCSTTLPSPSSSITLFPVPPSFSLPPLPPPVTAPPSSSYLSTETTTNRNNNNNNAEIHQSNTYASQATAPTATAAPTNTQSNFALNTNTNTNNGAENVNNMIMTVNNTSCTSIHSSPLRHGSISSNNNIAQVNNNNNTNNKSNMIDLHSQEHQSYILPSQLQTQQETQLSEIDSLCYRRNSSSLSNSAHYTNSNNNSNTRLSIHSINSTPPVMSEQRHLPIFVHSSNEFISPGPPPPPQQKPITMLLPHKNSLSSFTSSTTSLSTNRLAAVAIKASPIPQIQAQIQDEAQDNISHNVCPNECFSGLQHENYNKRFSDDYNKLHYNDHQYHHQHPSLHSPHSPHNHQKVHYRSYTHNNNNNSGNSQNRKHLNDNDNNVIIIKSEGNNIYDSSDTSITSTKTIRLPITDYDRKHVWHEVLLNERHLNYPNVPLPKEFANLGDSEERRRRLEQRHKQIMYGKDTEGYLKYITLIPQVAQREFHNPMHPITPRPENDCSKRTFDKYLNSWRRQLHQWDECDLNYLSREFTPMKVATLGDLHLATLDTKKDDTTKNESTNNNNINNTITTKEEEVVKCKLAEPYHREYECTETNNQNEERLFHNFTEKEELQLEEENYEKELELLEQEFEMQDNSMVIPVPTFSSTLSTPSSDDFSFFFSSSKDANKENRDYYTNKEINKPTALSFNIQNNNDDSCIENKNVFANKHTHYDDNMTSRKTIKMQHANDLESTDYNSYIERNIINSNNNDNIIVNTKNVNEGSSSNHDKLEFAAKDELSSSTLNDLMTNSALHLTDTTSSTVTENIYNSNNNNERQSTIYNALYKTNVNDQHEVSISDRTQSNANNAMFNKHSNTFVRQKTSLPESLNAHQSNADNCKRQLTNHDTNKITNSSDSLSINCKNDDRYDSDDDSFMNEFNQEMPILNLNIDFTTPESTLEYILSERVSNVPSAWTPSQTIATDNHKRNTWLRTLGTTPMMFTSTANGAYGNGETTIHTGGAINTTNNCYDSAKGGTYTNDEYEKESQLVEILTPVSPQTNHHNRSERSCGFMSLSRPQIIATEMVPHKDEPARVKEYTCNTSHNKNVNTNCTTNITTTTSSDKNDNKDDEDSFNALLDDVLGKVCSSRSTSQLTSLPHVKKSSRATTFDNNNVNNNNNSNNISINNENKKSNNNNYSEFTSIFSSPSPTPPSSRRTKQSSSSIRIPLRKIVNNSNSNSNLSSAHFAKEKGSTNNGYKRLSSVASLNPLSGRCSETQLSLPSLNQTGVSSSAVSINNNNNNCYSTSKSGSNTISDCVDVEDEHDNN